jgi:endo-1,4-beta-xylanase
VLPLRRALRLLVVAVVSLAALGALLVAATILTTPGRRGLKGAEERANAWRREPPLRELADRLGVRLGSAVMATDLANDPQYGPVLAREFNSLTPFVEMKWGTIHPEANRYDFTLADQLVTFAAAHGMRVRGHALVYGQAIDPPNPAYLTEITDPTALRTMMASHIRTVMTRYRGRVTAWDVVNEPLPSFGDPSRAKDGLAQHVFSRTLGPGYVAAALRSARDADPNAQLFINEQGTLEPGPRQDAYFRLVKELRASGVPIDAVGFQGHVVPLVGVRAPSASEVAATLRRFAALGVAVEITELNVFTRTPRRLLTLGLTYDEAEALRRQAEAYAETARGCLSVPACQGITVWTFTDRYLTTIERTTHIRDMPLIFDRDYRPKPAAFALREVLADSDRRPEGGR